MRVLLLADEEIELLLSMKEVMEAVETAFAEKGLGHAQMPAKQYLFYKRHNGDLRSMPSYLERLDLSAVKVVSVHPDNPARYNLPTVMATVVLIDPKCGVPLAIMGGTTITAMRTGAAGGIAAKYLACKGSKVIGLVGAGTQARTQLEALATLYGELEEVRVWSRTRSTRDRFVSDVKSECGVQAKLIPVEEVRDAVDGVHILVTSTPSMEPIISDEWISSGMHITCIGADAPGKQELDPAILKRSKIVVDDREQGLHSGEINVPFSKGMIRKEDIWADICEIVAGLRPGRTSTHEITVFASTGLAVQDAVTAKLAYDKAALKGVGKLAELV